LIEGRPISYVHGENKKSEKLFVQTGFSDGLLLSFWNIMNKRTINLAAAPIRTTRGAGCRFMADKNTFSDG